MSRFDIESGELEDVVQAMERFGAGAGQTVSDALHGSGELAYAEINPLIPVSGRRFKGHTSGAAQSRWPTYDTHQELTLTVAARGKWGYLYFPDDGTNTARHAGNQQFMRRGGEIAAPKIAQRCLAALMESAPGAR